MAPGLESHSNMVATGQTSPQHQTCNLRDAACLTNHVETGTVVVADW